MGAVKVTAFRTVGQLHGLLSTAFAVGCFLAVAAAAFSFALVSAEGGQLALPVVWATSVAPFLPALAALLAMGVWSDDRLTGRVDLLLTVAVRERDFVIGKFLGVWTMTVASLTLYLLCSLTLLGFLAPEAVAGLRPVPLLLAFGALLIQGTAWCAASVAMSALFSRAAAAACAAIILLVAFPRGLWAGLMAWANQGRTAFGEMPLDAHVVDFASGVIPVGTVVAYVVFAAVALFVATKAIASLRLVGRHAFGLRLFTGFSVALALVACGLTMLLSLRVNPTLDLSAAGVSSALSARTRGILAESGGLITVTCYLPRNDSRFRSVGRLLRLFCRESEAVGGARMALRFVDPRWDIGASERLVRQGVSENSIVFEKGRRMVSLPLSEGFGERICASAIRRIATPQLRRNVYWTVGHGENAFDAYGAFGMSDIARDLTREGFGNVTIDLTSEKPIPADCALILIAGAREDFSRVEIARLDAYLKAGGRLLVLLGSSQSGGVVSMLPSWGMRTADLPMGGTKTLSGSDVIVSGFTDHAITAPLRGSRIVLERPVSFAPSAVVGTGTGADSIAFSPVAEVGSAAVVAAIERGVGAGQDLALRPTRIVAIGDASFAMNGQLDARANANRDLFLNCAAFLSGTEAHGSGEADVAVFATGLDRAGRRRFVLWSVVVVPSVVFLLLALVGFRRRRRRT